MIKSLILLLFVCGSYQAPAQKIQQYHLINFTWFTDNSSKSFYKSDTISLIRIANQHSNYFKANRRYKELEYNHNKDITELIFKRDGFLSIVDVDVANWTESQLKKKWTWKFDFEKQLVSIFFHGRLHSSFVIKQKIIDKLVTKDNSTESKSEVYDLLIIKLVRAK